MPFGKISDEAIGLATCKISLPLTFHPDELHSSLFCCLKITTGIAEKNDLGCCVGFREGKSGNFCIWESANVVEIFVQTSFLQDYLCLLFWSGSCKPVFRSMRSQHCFDFRDEPAILIKIPQGLCVFCQKACHIRDVRLYDMVQDMLNLH